MEKLNFVNNGVLKLPPGFRFHPTDEELVVQYLKRKVFSYPLPASIIPEIDVCKCDPWDLPGDWGQERYFFSTREAKYSKGNRPNRATGSGYWKATGLDKKIIGIRGNLVVGMKKTLVFYRGKPPNGCRTDWIMHEYRLATSIFPKDSTQNSMVQMEDWVLCRIFLKKRKSKNENENENESEITWHHSGNRDRSLTAARPTFIDFMMKDKINSNSSSSSSSSGSSGITEVYSNVSDPEENSCCNSCSSSSCRKEQ